MKRVELRFLFVKDLWQREGLTLCKVPGTGNPADLGTRLLDMNTHRYLGSIIGLEPAKRAVEEIKGRKRNTQNAGTSDCRTCGKA